jgi:hypothetical protein
VQARMKSRRETPLASADSHTDGLVPSVMLPPTLEWAYFFTFSLFCQ